MTNREKEILKILHNLLEGMKELNLFDKEKESKEDRGKQLILLMMATNDIENLYTE